MQFRNYLFGVIMLVSGATAGYVPSFHQDKCDSCALIVAKLDVCLDIFDDKGHCDPVKACPCWKKKREDPLITAVLKLAIDEALSACVCASIG